MKEYYLAMIPKPSRLHGLIIDLPDLLLVLVLDLAVAVAVGRNAVICVDRSSRSLRDLCITRQRLLVNAANITTFQSNRFERRRIKSADESFVKRPFLWGRISDVFFHSGLVSPTAYFPEACCHTSCSMFAFIAVYEHWIIVWVEHKFQYLVYHFGLGVDIWVFVRQYWNMVVNDAVG